MTDKQLIEAWNMGYDAFEMGWKMEDCPFTILRDELRDAWFDGWYTGRDDLIFAEEEAMYAHHDEQDLKTLFNER